MKEPQPPISQGPPSRPQPQSPARQCRFMVLGAGSRGTAYAQAVTTTTTGLIHAVAEPHAFKRREFGRRFIWRENRGKRPGVGQEFGDWREWVAYEHGRRGRRGGNGGGNGIGGDEDERGVDGVFICTLDDQHVDILHAIAPFTDLHILCEKPLALSLADCLSVYRSLSPSPPISRKTIFSIGHVLRYNPHNILLRNLLRRDKVIGDIISLEHTEPVGWWHFAHSYVRGNWRRETETGDGSLLTKSCHDVDFLLWLLCSPVDTPTETTPGTRRTGAGPGTHGYHHPRSITSTGTLSLFTRSRKPKLAGNATNCLSCPAEQDCIYSAIKIYRDKHLLNPQHYTYGQQAYTDWPINIVCPDIEDTLLTHGPAAAEKSLLSALRQDYTKHTTPDEAIKIRPWYGRCVYESDNSVCDNQLVTLTWDPDPAIPGTGAKTAVLHMIAPTERQCQRRGRVYGTMGEISYDSHTITIHDFAANQTNVIEVPKQPPEEEKAHGGGDYGLARGFVSAVQAVVCEGWEVGEAQARFVGCTLEEAVRSHAVVFAAEEARRREKVVQWKEWWEGKLAEAGMN